MNITFSKRDAWPRFNFFGLVVLMIITALVSGCASEVQQPQSSAAATDDLSGYERVALQGGGVLHYKKLSDATFGYDAIHIGEVGIEYAKRSTELSAQEKKQVQKLLGESLARQIERFSSLVVDGPGICTASENVFLKDLELYKSNVSGSQSTVVKSLGAVTVVSEFRDSTSGELIFRYEERRGLGGGRRSSNTVDIVRLSRTLGGLIDEMAPKVFLALPKGSANSRASLGCEGRVGKQLHKLLQG